MVKISDVKQNTVEGFSILMDFGRIYIKADRGEDKRALMSLFAVNEVQAYGTKENSLVVMSDKDVRKVVKSFNELVWAKRPKKIYTPIPFGGTGEDEKGYGTDFVQGRR